VEALHHLPTGATRLERYGSRRARASIRRPRHARARQGVRGELPLLVLTALVLAVLVKGFLVQAFFIPSRSMAPNLEVGDRVMVNRLSYRLGRPEHGQVVVFLRPSPEGRRAESGALSWMRRAVAQGLGGTPPGNEDLIKRVVGIPGDVVLARGGRLWRNGRPVNEPYLSGKATTADFGPVRVQPDHYWLMGDNRQDSADSRFFGQVPRSALVGQALVRVWPTDRMGRL
jgi:signal peptidase I